jgi:hypothetical protein
VFQCVFTAGVREQVKIVEDDKADFAEQPRVRADLILSTAILKDYEGIILGDLGGF